MSHRFKKVALGYRIADILSSALSADIHVIRQPTNIVSLLLSVALLPFFAWWMRRQELRGKPALIPNRLWKNSAFTSVCLMVLLSSAVTEGMELFASLL